MGRTLAGSQEASEAALDLAERACTLTRRM